MIEVMRYSEAFKLQVLRELEEGRFPTREAARRAYRIRGSETLCKWIRKYGKNELLNKVVRMETPEEVSELKQLKKRNRDLEKALADAHLDHLLDDAYLKIACEAAGIEDVEAFKKKHGGRR